MALDLNEHTARGKFNGHKQIALADLVGHLGQVFDIDADEPQLVTFEGFVRLTRFFGFEGVEIANAVAAKIPIKARTYRVRANKLAGEGQQII